MAIEIELKLDAPDAPTLERIARLENLAGYALEDRGTVHIADTAFDTPDGALYRGRAVLRLRETGGQRFLTFKAHAPSPGGYFRRIEEEAPTTATAADIARGDLPDLFPAHAFREQFGAALLAPRLATANDRHVMLLVRDGVPRYELALDSVTFTGPRGEARIYEVEVEALTGDAADLDDIGAWLRDRFPLADAGPSKFIRGMDLVG